MLRAHSHLATTTQIFDFVSHGYRDGLHCHQCNCSHMTTEKEIHRCRQVRMDPNEPRKWLFIPWHLLKFSCLLPAATKLWPRLCFLHVSVILLTGGEGGLRRTPPPGDQGEPPWTRQTTTTPPWDQGEPPGPGRPPWTRQTPRTKENPPPPAPGRPPPPPAGRTAAYGQWAAGTHPTGMHSCHLNDFADHSYLKDLDSLRKSFLRFIIIEN